MSERDTEETIDNLQNDREPIEESSLIQLSNLTREEQARLDEVWRDIPLDKRRHMVRLMGEKADEDFQLDFKAVFRRGLQDADAEVRRESIEGLWEDESVTLIRPFLRLLEDESDVVRASAATALGRFVLQGELGHLTEERYEELVEALVKIVSDPSIPISVRRRAVESVAYSGDERVRDIIARAYEDESEEMRTSAVFAMGRSADEYWSGLVRGELFNEDPAFRFEAARAAGELSDSSAVPRLIALLKDRDREVRKMVIWALGQIGGAAAREALKGVIRGEQSASIRRLAQDCLAELNLLDEDSPSLFLDPSLYKGEEEDDTLVWDDDENDSGSGDDESDDFDEDGWLRLEL
ncbi:MAG: HEAT repeat domain-containing protein [Chloroflexota bacterium]|nr:HEAT repeat domain-containing protein [Chloroflexota bacterium]